MIRLNQNEINDLLDTDHIINLYEMYSISEFIDDNEDLKWIREAFSIPFTKSNNKENKITSLSELNARIDNILTNEPKGVIRVIKIYKLISWLLYFSGSVVGFAGGHTKVADYLGVNSDSSFTRFILGMLGASLTNLVIKQIDTKFLARLVGKIARVIGGSKCRASDQEKIRLFNELIKSVNNTINRSKSMIEREALQDSMNKAIELRDQISSRLHLMNKKALPVENGSDNQQQTNNNQ